MSIPRASWNCPVCGFETDFPKSSHICLLKNCPHPTRRDLTPDERAVNPDDYVVCGQDLARLEPTAELRFVEVNHRDWNGNWVPPTLEQKWVAKAKMPDGGMWEEYRWRAVPIVKPDKT